MNRSPLKRKIPLKASGKVKRKPIPVLIRNPKRPDLSSMTCCIEARQRAGRLVLLGCVVCGRPANVHHLRAGQGMGERAPWWETIGLCQDHHQGDYSTHGRDREQFHADHGTEREMLERVNASLPANLCGPTEEQKAYLRK